MSSIPNVDTRQTSIPPIDENGPAADGGSVAIAKRNAAEVDERI